MSERHQQTLDYLLSILATIVIAVVIIAASRLFARRSAQMAAIERAANTPWPGKATGPPIQDAIRGMGQEPGDAMILDEPEE